MDKVLNKVLPGKQEGATAVEYGLIAALIAVVLVIVMLILQGGLEGAFENIAAALTNAGN